ncbi:polysaccharide deacetylase [Arcobacter venerupis]|uniref:Polysaccharide deacetylase n=1 Tax=Arcobacter venerupis TaxID=1054033 RepID=A0AAE7BAK4_9BACT|nr:polysaccharide deacetylase family protein [Arcobacter venerupis]QKF66842.1 polysaccharide deacetylase [Arcobacter venerupis]RWS49837.1 polysaccharide deacetylase [Arcobacter venerupis]
MKQSIIFSLLLTLSFTACANSASDSYFTEQPANSKKEYESFRKNIAKAFENQTPKQWGENVTGVKTHLNTNEKVIALTMDACGSPLGMAYDEKLVNFLKKEKIPATMFINARWINKNLSTFKELASNPLFEIANHGLEHKPASVNGKSIYGLSGTNSVEELVDEIELNARKIESITHKRPKYFRSGTAYYDEVAVSVANKLNHQVVGFSILGDAGATFSAKKVEEAFLKAKKGEIVIIHMNHPTSDTAQGTINAITKLKQKGFKFVKLSDYKLK